MRLFGQPFGGADQDDGDQPPTMPWDQKPSIDDHARSRLDSNEILTDDGTTLPDDERTDEGARASYGDW